MTFLEKWDDSLQFDRKEEGLRVSGCGMDMGFKVVYCTSSAIFPTYKCRGDKCPSSDHLNNHSARDGKATHKDGYCLRQKWL